MVVAEEGAAAEEGSATEEGAAAGMGAPAAPCERRHKGDDDAGSACGLSCRLVEEVGQTLAGKRPDGKWPRRQICQRAILQFEELQTLRLDETRPVEAIGLGRYEAEFRIIISLARDKHKLPGP